MGKSSKKKDKDQVEYRKQMRDIAFSLDKIEMEGSSIRINIGVNSSCIKEIDETIQDTGLFNSRVDFVTAALRDTVLWYTRNAPKELETSFQCNGGKTATAWNAFIQTMHDLGKSLTDDYVEEYGSGLDAQIPIRLTEDMYFRVRYTAWIMAPDIPSFCRMAIARYLDLVIMDDSTGYAEACSTLCLYQELQNESSKSRGQILKERWK